MASVCLNSIYHYQPAPSRGRPVKGRSTACNRGASAASSKYKDSIALAPNVPPSAGLGDYDLIECFDLTTSLPMEAIDPFGEPALGFGGTENAQDLLAAGPPLVASDRGNDGLLPSCEELLPDIGEAHQPQHGIPNVGDGSGGAHGRSSVHLRSDSSISEELGGQQGPLSTPPISVPGREARSPTLREKTNCPVSTPPSPPPPPPPAAGTVLSSMSDRQKESSDSALKDVGPGPPGEGKEKVDIDNGHTGDKDKRDGDGMATGATGIGDSSKRTADKAGLNEAGEGVPRSKKVRRTDPIDEIDDADHDQILAQIRSQPKPVFRYPPSWRDFQQPEDTTSSSRSSGAGGSQNDPLVVEDDSVMADEISAPIKAASIKPETGTTYLLSSLRREDLKTLSSLNAPITPDPPTEPLDWPTSPAIALPQHLEGRDVGKDDHGAAAVASPPNAITPPRSLQSPAPSPALEEEQWEIRKIVGKRRVGKGYQYRVRWKDTWLSGSEMGNAQDLLRDFKAQSRAHGSRKQGKPARVTKRR